MRAKTMRQARCASVQAKPAMNSRHIEGPGMKIHSTTNQVGGVDASLQQPRGRTLAAKRKRPFHPNRPSAYVSLGKVRPFTGDVQPPAALTSALEARSFRRELILITDTRPRAAVQLHDNLAQLGLAHILWLTNSRAFCAAADVLLLARAKLHGQQPGAFADATLAHRALKSASVPYTSMAQDWEGQLSLSRQARELRNAQALPALNVSAAMAALAAASDAAASGRRNIISSAAGAGLAAAASSSSSSSSADLGCVWYNETFPDVFGGHRRLMTKRLMLLARTVRHGYNVLSLDTDVIAFREPYSFFKTPPYSSAHMVVGKSVRGGSIVNTGVMYFQNVSRNGPVAWLLSEAVERNLRWLDMPPPPPAPNSTENSATAALTPDKSSSAAHQLMTPHDASRRGCWDQFLFGDAVLTSITGKMSLYYCARPADRYGRPLLRRSDDDSGGWNMRHRTALGLADRQGPSELLGREVTPVTDPDLLGLVGSDTFMTSWANLTRPRDPQPLLADEPSYRLPPFLPDGFAARFQRVLADDDNLWASRQSVLRSMNSNRRLRTAVDKSRCTEDQPDVAQGSLDTALCSSSSRHLAGEEAAADVRRRDALGAAGSRTGDGPLPPLHREMEMLAYAADWLVGGWTQRGVLGYWDPQLTNGMPRQVFAHLVRAPGPTSIGKDAVRMQYGEYSWELAALTDGGPFPFLGSPNASEVPRVVALLPDVDTTTFTQVQWTSMARGLVQLALLTGRRVVWPAVPCASKWVQPNPGSRRALPLNQNLRFMTHGSFGEGLMCTPAVVLHQKCLFERLNSGRNESSEVARDEVPEPPRREGARGLLPVEFEMLLRVLPPSVAQPGSHNTVHLQNNDDYDDNGRGERPVMFDEPPRAELYRFRLPFPACWFAVDGQFVGNRPRKTGDNYVAIMMGGAKPGIVYVKAADVAKALREGPLAAQPVLYLAQRTFLTQLDKLGEPELMVKYRTFRNECPALK
ncbi:hypothetical protein VOLCADRAFT_89755 [Volvox carteri f. nagariensis]|uniref:Nucleotide-diphospho-sugar transferase domain-containing protein n=1 Tax=Volvox carteri f. nagariensis TaxID=3068 RepID=D8TSJ8_VOLCA|nr:uncharacterized protein VOLCADRAFT_89755 [Volvox carteri f. nagariensis]EFJ49501.1 hypothetical protein VOLCADRAFT_89755 [Volvox carteri f. nagariensis]|eukprot:XP_002949482.1 hypothetical protein VOLCADRAFT_89755 [Volvox carteri f. nagariensis]